MRLEKLALLRLYLTGDQGSLFRPRTKSRNACRSYFLIGIATAPWLSEAFAPLATTPYVEINIFPELS